MEKEKINQFLDIVFLRLGQQKKLQNVAEVKELIINNEAVLNTLIAMEETGGEPALMCVHDDKLSFVDSVLESPVSRRSLCYDIAALNARKVHKPEGDACSFALKLGGNLISEKHYLKLQCLKQVDLKSQSWLRTPEAIRNRGGAVYGENRYGRIFIGANGAESYFSHRGIRLEVILPL